MEHKQELDILTTQLSRIILDADDEIMQVHIEYFSKRLMTLFLYYNSSCFESKEQEAKVKKYLFLNLESNTWNTSFKDDIEEYKKSIDNMDAVIQ